MQPRSRHSKNRLHKRSHSKPPVIASSGATSLKIRQVHAPLPQQKAAKLHPSQRQLGVWPAGPKPRHEQRMSLAHDGRPFTTGDMPSPVPMNPQTAIRQRARLYLAGTRHVLLTFLNENPRQLLACQRDLVVLDSPGSTRLLALNGD